MPVHYLHSYYIYIPYEYNYVQLITISGRLTSNTRTNNILLNKHNKDLAWKYTSLANLKMKTDHIWVVPEMVVPQNTPKLAFLVGNPMVVKYHHFRKPPNQNPTKCFFLLDVDLYPARHLCFSSCGARLPHDVLEEARDETCADWCNEANITDIDFTALSHPNTSGERFFLTPKKHA